jgi:hypothetical protein
MPVWPLDDGVLQEGYDEAFPDNVARFETDIGPGKRRPRSTAAPQPISFLVPLTAAEAATLESFFRTDLAEGALSFDWKHPRKGSAATMHFTAPPRISARGAMFVARLEIDVEV